MSPADAPSKPVLNKRSIVEKIIASLAAELEGYARSARAAHAEATHEQSKAENKYDTRGLEASYLARGQSRQAAEIMQAIQRYQSLSLRQFAPEEPIDIGAVVELDRQGERSIYFVGPRAGGTEIDCEAQIVAGDYAALADGRAARRTQARRALADDDWRIKRKLPRSDGDLTEKALTLYESLSNDERDKVSGSPSRLAPLPKREILRTRTRPEAGRWKARAGD